MKKYIEIIEDLISNKSVVTQDLVTHIKELNILEKMSTIMYIVDLLTKEEFEKQHEILIKLSDEFHLAKEFSLKPINQPEGTPLHIIHLNETEFYLREYATKNGKDDILKELDNCCK